MQRVGEHPVPAGPLAVRWHGWELVRPARAGSLTEVDVVLENAGSASWEGFEVSYHWLDDRGNAIVWGGIWTPITRLVEPGETITVRMELRAPLVFGRQPIAFDIVDARRYWLSEIGNVRLEAEIEVAPRIERRLAVLFNPTEPHHLMDLSNEALAAQEEQLVPLGEEAAIVHLTPGCRPMPDWSRRILDAHQQGYVAVGGSVDTGRFFRPKELKLWRPGTGRVPKFEHPLICASLIPGSEPSWSYVDIAGLPAFAHPKTEPWLYDGRIVIKAPPRSGRRSA